MELIGLNSMSWEQIQENKIMDKVFAEDDPVTRAEALLTVKDRCKAISKTKDFELLVKAYTAREKAQKRVCVANGTDTGMTAFEVDGTPYKNLPCGAWNADESGIWAPTFDQNVKREACKHPVLIAGRYHNLQTGEERVKIAYKRNNLWNDITVAKSVIASASKIVQLSDYGILVTSENAKHMVKYLADMEAYAEAEIEITDSTTKLGWSKDGGFIPYDMQNITFDGEKQFGHLYTAIASKGSRDAWMNEVLSIRKRNRIETKIMIAASLAAPLIQKVGCLPFFVDLNGITEGGKTVSLMLAASIWANPDGGAYIGDFMCTNTNLEVKADLLNNLPVLLDDSAKSNKSIAEDFQTLIYTLCSGKGKGRSNRELGLNRTYEWRTVFICNGERPLSEYVDKGGAINRIVEVPAGDHIFTDPAKTAELLKKNYGWFGKEYIKIVKEIPEENLIADFNDIVQELQDPSKMQKQTQSMACMILADRIAEKYLFRDGNTISIDEAKKLIVDLSTVSDSQRCYEYVVGECQANQYRFTYDADKPGNYERWGTWDEKANEVRILPHILDRICKEGKFSKSQLIKWAMKNNLIDVGNDGKSSRPSKMPPSVGTFRMIFLKLPPEEQEEESPKFLPVNDNEKLPFD